MLEGAEDLELKKPIKANFGGGVKEFIFEEQEFYHDIEDEEKFLSTQERQSIINEILNKITCGEDFDEPLVLQGRKVPNGRKLSKKFTNIYFKSLYIIDLFYNLTKSILVHET